MIITRTPAYFFETLRSTAKKITGIEKAARSGIDAGGRGARGGAINGGSEERGNNSSEPYHKNSGKGRDPHLERARPQTV